MTAFVGTAGDDSLPNPQLLGVLTAIGNDTFQGLAGNDLLVGYLGDDVIDGGSGADVMLGGILSIALNIGTLAVAGIDTATYAGSTAGVTVDLGTVQDNLSISIAGITLQLSGVSVGVGGDAQGDQLAGITNLTGSDFGDHLFGNASDNTILGGGGNDTLRGGAGADHLDGGTGVDFANYQGSTAAVTVDLLNHTASGGDAQGDVLTNIGNLYGSSNADHLSGDNDRNIIGGENGDDVLVGNGGDDAMNGENGADNLDGGDGNDRLVGGQGIDTIHGGAGTDSIDGGTENDILFGDAGTDTIFGNTGDDQINGGDGNDILIGSVGADALVGGAGVDLAHYGNSSFAVTVNLALGTGLGGDAQGDTLTGIENVVGSNHDDVLTGDDNANQLAGGAGADILTGGAGGDLLRGGTGNDTFVYLSISDSTVASAGKDSIGDFTTGDKIDLSAIDADGNPNNGNTAFHFSSTPGGFSGQPGEIKVVDVNGVQLVGGDTNGDRIIDFAINVYSDHHLTASDFVL
jgi:Ca2+-binding RTX toxin-like protein